MITLRRIRNASELRPGLHGTGRQRRELELLTMWRDHLADGAEASPPWKSAHWKEGKPALSKSSAGKCAYCETPFSVGGHGDVEHFRPKSTYWWLAYCYDNHSFSCQICNQTYKGDKFPIQGTAMKGPRVTPQTTDARLATLAGGVAPDAVDASAGLTHTRYAAACAAEKPGLLDPYLDDPADYFAWEVDDVNHEVTLIPVRSTSRVKFVISSSEAALGLNREELRRRRFDVYDDALGFKEIAEDPGVPVRARDRAIKQLQKMAGPGRPYSGMVLFFLKKWKIPLS